MAGAHDSGNDAESLAAFRKAVELEPDNTETLTRLSAFLDRLGAADASAAKRDRIAALTTVVTTFATRRELFMTARDEALKTEALARK